MIALDIVHDGFRAASAAVAELADGLPRELGGTQPADEAEMLRSHLQERFSGAEVRLRETGRYMIAEVRGAADPPQAAEAKDYWPGDSDRAWRFAEISFSP